jgi:hypothetical protein
MLNWFREKLRMSEVALQKLAIAFAVVMTAFGLAACGGGGGGTEEIPATVNFPPVVFMAAKDNAGIVELYAASEDGVDIIKLSGTMVAGGNVVEFKVSPDGIYAAYVADQDSNGLFELYVVPVDKTSGESAVKVSVPLEGSGIRETAAGSGAYYFAWAPDSSRVAYIADANDGTADFFELFSSTPDGSQQNLVSDLSDTNSDVQDFQWEPESSLIAYVADQDTLGKFELYVSPTDGNSPNYKVSGSSMAGDGIKEDPVGSGRYAFAWAFDSSRIAYIADQDLSDRFELYTSRPDGAGNLTISGPLGIGQDVAQFKWAPDSQQIAYTANQVNVHYIDLFSASPDVNYSSQLNSTGLSAGREVSSFKWAPDSSRIAFLADKDFLGIFLLYSVQPVNSKDISISGGLLPSEEVTEFEWAPDSSRIAYLVAALKSELFTTFSDIGSSTQIKPSLTAGGDVFAFEWAPDSSRIAYTADHFTAGVIELFSSTPDNSVTGKVSSSMVSGGDVTQFKWAPDNSGIGYIADQDTNDVFELFASLPDGGDNTKLSGDLVAGGDVTGFEWVPE